ncbi:MAG TPA: MarR family transcriptional regulator [Jatrophihabitantaceae bacterium]|jgi:DNA-binding MarR family transcriptional regulator
MDDVDTLAEQLRVNASRLVRTSGRSETLPPGESAVLATLEREGPQTIAQLAEERGVRHQTAAKIVAQLEAAGYAAKRNHPDDARMVLVRVTRSGATALRRDRKARAAWLAEAIRAQLTVKQQARLGELVTILGALASYDSDE